jgi:hypothetical protein
MAEHTPGPWCPQFIRDTPMVPRVAVRAEVGMAVRAEGGDEHTYVAFVPRPAVGSREGNARLIAAAPELLAACRAVLAEIEDDFLDPSEVAPEWVALREQLRAAIAGATSTE